jgi:hypothetical protein
MAHTANVQQDYMMSFAVMRGASLTDRFAIARREAFAINQSILGVVGAELSR